MQCNGIVDNISVNICVPSKTKCINVKVLNMIRASEVKKIVKHISCDCKCKFNSPTHKAKEISKIYFM